MKRTTVFADENDPAALRAAAQRRGTAEAQLLREAIHRVALATRRWDEPFFSRTYAPEPGPAGSGRRDPLEEVVDERTATTGVAEGSTPVVVVVADTSGLVAALDATHPAGAAAR